MILEDVEFSVDLLRTAFASIISERKKKGLKFMIALHVVFCKASNPMENTNPPRVMKSLNFTCLQVTALEEKLRLAYEQIFLSSSTQILKVFYNHLRGMRVDQQNLGQYKAKTGLPFIPNALTVGFIVCHILVCLYWRKCS